MYKNGSVMYRISVRPLTPDEIQSPTEKKERDEFDIAIEKRYGASMDKSDFKDDPDYAYFFTPTYDFYEDYKVSSYKMPDIDDIKEEHDAPSMARKIMKNNGSVMYRTSVRPLTPDEIQSPTEKKEREEFDIAIEKKFSSSMDKNNFKDDPYYAYFVTPTYDCYEDYKVSSKMPDIDDTKEEHDGPAMARKIIKNNGSVMYRTSVRPLTPDEIQSPTEKKEREEFDIAIEKKFSSSMDKSDFKDDPYYAYFVTPTYDCYEDYKVSSSKMPYIYDIKEEHDVDTYDQYVGAHVMVSH
jgi:hypothetical protein